MAGGGANVDDLIKKIRTQNLPAQIEAKQQKITAMGGKAKKGGPSVLSRVFDVIQRPLYGIEETMARGSEHMGHANPRKGKNAASDIFGGFIGGLAGKQKTHGSDIMRRAAEADPNSLMSKTIRENRFGIKSIGGFVLDVGLDPLTYLSGGLSKASKAEAVLGKTAKIAETVADGKKAGGELKVLRSVARKEAKKVATAESITKSIAGEGKVITSKELHKACEIGADAASNAAVKDIADKTLEKSFDPARRLNIKFAGKPVASIPVQKAFVPLDKVAASKVGQAIGGKFSTKALYAEKTKEFLRKFSSSGVAQFERTAREVRTLFKGLSEDQLTTISHALEGDKDALARMAEDAPEKLGHIGDSGAIDFSGDYRTLEDYRKAAKHFFDDIHEQEAHRWIMKDADKADNYVYHHYDIKDQSKINSFKKARKGSLKNGKLELTLREAEKKGLSPVTNIDELMVRRAGKSYARRSQADITHAILNEYKITTKDTDIIKAFKDANSPIKKVEAGQRSFRHGDGALSQLREAGHLKPNEELFLPEHIFNSLKNIDDLHRNAGKVDKFFKYFDKVQQPWKFAATAANPGHHVRNAIGDAYLNFMDGVVDPRHYTRARKLIWSKDAEALSKMQIRVGDTVLNGHDILKLYEDSGAKSGFFRAEYGTSLAEKRGIEKLKGVKDKIVDFAEKREDTGRLAHFLHAIQEEGKGGKNLGMLTKELDDVADKAAARVRKWNVDYGDLTPFETDYVKRIIPFYTWMRKNIPLQMEAIAMRPGRVSVVPKFNNAIEQMLGTENNFENAVIPKWLKEMAPISLVGEGEGKNGIYWAPNLPIQDLTRFMEGGKEGILREIMGTTSPFIRAPYEEAFGESLFSGAPIRGQGQYAAQQVPMANEIYGLLKKGGSPGETGVFGRRLKADQLFNYLTGMGVQDVGERERASELRRQEDISQFQMKDLRNKLRRKLLGG